MVKLTNKEQFIVTLKYGELYCYEHNTPFFVDSHGSFCEDCFNEAYNPEYMEDAQEQ